MAQDGAVLTEAQLAAPELAALETAKAEKDAHGAFESQHPGSCGAQDSFYVGMMTGVGRIHQQAFIDTYSKRVHATPYDRKTPITAADVLNHRGVPFPDAHDVPLLRILTDRGTDHCASPERHQYDLSRAGEDIDHSRTKTKSPQTNGIVERCHKTALNTFYRIAFRNKLHAALAEPQEDLDEWIKSYTQERPHQGRWCYGTTPMATFPDTAHVAREKLVPAA